MPVGHGQYPSDFPNQLPPIVERDAYRVLQLPLPPFMDKWLKPGSERLDSYLLPDIGSPSSSKLPEVGSPPGKRSWPFAGNVPPVELARLHGSTLPKSQPPEAPQIRTLDLDEVEARLMASQNPQKLTPETPELPKSRPLVDKLVTTDAFFSSDDADLDPVAFVCAVKSLSLRSHQGTLLDLQEYDSYEEMAEFVKTLAPNESQNLLTPMRNWKAAGKLYETKMIGLLILETDYVPSPKQLKEFMGDLPCAWPRALEHLRKPCLDRHVDNARRKTRVALSRAEFVRRLTARYPDPPKLHG